MKKVNDIIELLPLYIAKGNPSDDTIKAYREHITAFAAWCDVNKLDIFGLGEESALDYVRGLYNNRLSCNTVAIKLAAIKAFYSVAVRRGVALANPFDSIKARVSVHDDSEFNFYTLSELKQLVSYIKSNSLDECNELRNLALIMLMGVEGLRGVEVCRLNEDDIDFGSGVVYVRGKGHDGYVYPCSDTLETLENYFASRPCVSDDFGIPAFVTCRNNVNNRLTRSGLRWIINNLLTGAGLKRKGSACHSLRHSCGTNLYLQTKDLRLVQETLRQKSPSVAARYAHIVERRANRSTLAISPLR